MKFRKITVLFVIMIFAYSFNVVTVHASITPPIEAVYGTTPTIDGTISAGEWDDASTTTFDGPSGTCIVYVKQDGSNLYIGINIPDTTPDSLDRFEVCLDTNDDEGVAPNTDDYLFFIYRPLSGYFAEEYIGDGVNWIPQTISGWTGAASLNPTSLYVVELSIGYSKLGVTPGIAKQLGIEFSVEDGPVDDTRYSWTPGSEIDLPMSWGNIASTDYLWVPWFTSLPIVLLISIPLVIFLRKKSHSLQNTV